MTLIELLNMLAYPNGLRDITRTGGWVKTELRRADGTVETREFPNLVVDTGLYHIADQLAEQDEGQMSHMAIGSGTTPAAAGDTALESELGRVALTSITQGAGGDANDVIYVATFPAGTGTGAVTEAGIFNATPAGVMLCRAVFAVINKAAGDALTITWTLTLTAV
jgi:hypothetical protein